MGGIAADQGDEAGKESTWVLPPRISLYDTLHRDGGGQVQKQKLFSKGERSPPRKGKAWTEDEHLAFLAGLKKLGRGQWRGISRYYVPTRTSTQIASHAQKYLQRITGATKRKSKFSELEEQVSGDQLEERLKPLQQIVPSKEGGSLVSHAALSQGRSAHMCRVPTGDNACQQVCRPTAIRATASENDLQKMLASLGDASGNLSPSDTSAFRRAGSVKA